MQGLKLPRRTGCGAFGRRSHRVGGGTGEYVGFEAEDACATGGMGASRAGVAWNALLDGDTAAREHTHKVLHAWAVRTRVRL